MKASYLIQTNYLNHYSLRLLVGNILLNLPTFCVALMILIWERLDFLLVLPASLSIGLLLVLPSIATIARPSKERVAVDALVGGVVMMVPLCFVVIPLKNVPIEWAPIKWAIPPKEKGPILRDQSSLIPKVAKEDVNPK